MLYYIYFKKPIGGAESGTYCRCRLTKNKRVEIGLTYIFGIGRPTSRQILTEAGIDFDTRIKDLTEEQVSKIRELIEKLGIIVEGDLRREIALNIKRLMEIGCYRGIRHRRGLPVRGQKQNKCSYT